MSRDLWFRDPGARRLIAFGSLPWLAGLNLVWEAAHVRLYTLWYEATPATIAFSVLHCVIGDVLIGLAALLSALITLRAGPLAQWRWRPIAFVTAALGLAYTVFSEWMNITWLGSWAYAPSMPTLELAGFELGVTPLAQWLLVPPLSLYLAQRTAFERRTAP